jgi:shikimate dehydrogenase/3-dehydroquinate dehydratase type I
MRGVVHSILEATPEAVVRRLDEAPRVCALVEIRADALRAGDVAGLVRRAGRPVAVTVRTIEDGGSFDGSTAEKRSILFAALAEGAAFVDVEWDGPLREIAFGPESGRTILSHHGAPCEGTTLDPLLSAMAGTKAARLKIVPRAARLAELRAVRDLLARARLERLALCSFAMGSAGTWSRVAALLWGSWGTYGAAARGRETGDGQLDTVTMLEVYRVLAISEATTTFALCGTPLSGSPSPTLHAAGYKDLGLDAVYVPIDSGDLDDVAALLDGGGPLAISGFGVTIPLKEHAARRCVTLDPFAACGSANTVVVRADGWAGFNTDAPAALALIRRHFDPCGRPAAILGAGGTARAIAAALVSAGAIVTLYSRSATKGEDTARAVGAASAPWAALPGAAWDLLVQATPAGRNGEEVLLRRHLNGRMVLDAAYGVEATPLVRAARVRGMAVADGLDLLGEQAALQFERLTGRAAPREAMAAALQPWRDASSA